MHRGRDSFGAAKGGRRSAGGGTDGHELVCEKGEEISFSFSSSGGGQFQISKKKSVRGHFSLCPLLLVF